MSAIEWIPLGTRIWRSSDGRWKISNTGGYRLFRDDQLLKILPTFSEAIAVANKVSQDAHDRGRS